MKYAFHIQPCAPVCFDTAQGELVLDTMADAMLRDGTIIRGWLINDKTDLNLFPFSSSLLNCMYNTVLKDDVNALC